MKVIVKTLKGEKFPIELDASATVESIKQLIETTKADMPASCMKLIHSGKVLKDSDSVLSCGIKENDFLVVMVTKPKKPAVAPPVPAAPPTPATPVASVPVESNPPPASNDTAPPAAAATAEAPPPEAEATAADPTAAAETPPPDVAAEDAAAAATDEFATPEMVANLTALGFPETEVRHCLRAAQGNPDVAVEFLTNGIPAFMTGTGAAAASTNNPPLQALRNHPQFNDLRRLVQTNPAMLQQVLTQIGQQQPDLLREINANQAAFLELMNEPIVATTTTTTTTQQQSQQGSRSTITATGSSSSSDTPSSRSAAALAGTDPAQMAQMMQNMDPGQLQMMATMMGLSPEQVQAVGRMIGQLPPDQLQEYMAQAMGGGGGMSAPPGQHVLRLTEEEMAAVDRLTEMGFDRSEAAQAFLACDKNEAMAANLLMDGGFGFGGMDEDDDDMGGGGAGDDDDDMYS